jgi:hypothetical protein
MLKALNLKILLAIFAILAAIGGALAYQQHETEKSAAAAAKAAAIVERQRKEADEQRLRDEAFRQRVELDRKRHNSAAAHEGSRERDGPGAHPRDDRCASVGGAANRIICSGQAISCYLCLSARRLHVNDVQDYSILQWQ